MKSNRGFCCFSLPPAPARVTAWRRFRSVYLSLHFGRDPTEGRFALFRCRRYRRASQLAALLVGAFLFPTSAEAQPEDIFPSSAALGTGARRRLAAFSIGGAPLLFGSNPAKRGVKRGQGAGRAGVRAAKRRAKPSRPRDLLCPAARPVRLPLPASFQLPLSCSSPQGRAPLRHSTAS